MTILERVNGVFREIFDDPALVVTPETNASHVKGWDSFAHVNLIVALEEHFGVSFTTREITSMTCVGDLLRLLDAKAAR